ncbi:MAG: DUF3572 domain-containing protein [Rhodobacterales bacterium]|nr:DUF3572 domain-containing protein [Rhodobacterales bacterium]
MTRDEAETLALQALAWMAGQEGLLAAFLAETGADVAALAAGAHRPEVLAGVLDFLLADDARVTGFARDAGLPPDRPLRARAALPGGALPHWT